MKVLSVAIIALAETLLFTLPAYATPLTEASAWRARVGEAQKLFTAAHKALGSGATFTAAGCDMAEPLLDQALTLLEGAPIEYATGTTPYTALLRGYCYAVRGGDEEAARLFRLALVPTPGNEIIVQSARACLATQYANGRGVAQDREKALALYMLSAGATCPLLTADTITEAADTLLLLDPRERADGSSEIYQLLQRGQARHWWWAVKLFEQANRSTGNIDGAIMMSIRGLDAGGNTAEDDTARKGLSLELGKLFEPRNRAIAIGYYLAANSPDGQAAMARIIPALGYRLVLPSPIPGGATQ